MPERHEPAPERHEPALAQGPRGRPSEVAHLRALLADIAELAAVIELSGRLSYLNRAGRRLLLADRGAGTESLVAADLVAPAERDAFARQVIPTVTRDGAWSGVITLVRTNGAEVPTRSTLRAHPCERGTAITWVARDITTDRMVYEALHKKIFEDELTGLPHRSIFLDRLDLSLRRARPDSAAVALLFVGLDRFKEKNDRFGREVGDELLRAVAHRLGALLPPNHALSRWGGDEFVVACEGVADEAAARALADELLAGFADAFAVSAGRVFLAASVGAALARPGDLTADQLLRHAEAAGQMAKRRGGSTVHLFDGEMRARALRRAEVEDALRGAAERGELVLHYQPEVCLRTQEIVAVEALVRWMHPEWGLVPPAEFVPAAEASPLILELGAWVLRAAMEQASRWRSELAGPAPSVSVNISARQFERDDFVDVVAAALEATGLEPSRFCLEITEGVLMADLEITTTTLSRLKALGVKLAVDDFGTGYSSLSYLRRFPVDVLKLDQSFVRDLGRDPEDAAIVQAMIHMGRALNLLTVAEGVETARHLIELRALQCDIAQGYHFSRPRPVEDITQLLRAGSGWMAVP